ncbi:MAG: DUF2336 domain-containing protein [Pseudomonadota bacterium]
MTDPNASKQDALSAVDVAQLLADPSAETRAETAQKIAQSYNQSALGIKERMLAEQIFAVMAKDVTEQVRVSLAENLKTLPSIPRDLARTIANDVESVAVPFIKVSDVLSDEDLLEIVKTKPATHQVAVASRPQVSALICDALVDNGNSDVVHAMVKNEGADIREETMSKALDRHGNDKRISTAMAERQVLPLDIAERLVSLVSDKIRDHLATHHNLGPDMAADLVMQSRERATVALLDGNADAPDVHALVDQLGRNGRLTPTLVVRALCTGDVVFFEYALSRLAKVPLRNVYLLLNDKGDLGVQRLFDKCGMPVGLVGLAREAIAISKQLRETGTEDREAFRTQLIERLMTQFGDDMPDENIDYLIAKLSNQNTELVSGMQR